MRRPAFQQKFEAVKFRNKMALADLIAARLGIHVDPSAMFDVQIKRIHEYKRQLLNALEAAALYLAIKAEPECDWTPRVKIFAGKARRATGRPSSSSSSSTTSRRP